MNGLLDKLLTEHRHRDMSVFLSAVTSVKHLALVPEVQETLAFWAGTTRKVTWVLIGGLALSLYRKPRTTQDVDVLLLNEASVPGDFDVDCFDKVGPHTFQGQGTNVRVELVTPHLVNLPEELVARVFHTARTLDGIKVASVEGMIALKLHGADRPKRKHGDMADIVAMLIHHGSPVDMTTWTLSTNHQLRYRECIDAAFSERN